MLYFQGIATDVYDKTLEEIITEAINKLQVKIQEAIEKGQKLIKEAADKLYEDAQALLQKTKAKIAEIIKKALDKIHQLTGTEENPAALKCVEVADGQLSELNDRILKQAGTCIDKNVGRIVEISDETLNGLNNIVGFIGDDLNRLHACKDVKCFVQLLADVAWQTVNLPIKIVTLFDHTYLTIKGILKDVVVCTADATIQVVNGANIIIDDASKCVQDALQNNVQL